MWRPVPYSEHGVPERTGARLAGAFGALLIFSLAGCATSPRYSPEPTYSHRLPPPASPSRSQPGTEPGAQTRPDATYPAPNPARPRADLAPLNSLSGWAEDDHAAALAAFQQTCSTGRQPLMQRICREARSMGSADSETARRFFEQHFRVELLAGEGVLTGYFAPVYSARRHRDAVYSAPVRPLPQPGATLSFIAPDSRMSDQARHQAEEIAAVTGSAPSLDAAYAAALPASSPPTGGSSDPVADLLGRDDAPHASTDMSSSPPERTQLVRFQEADRSVIEQAPADDALAWMKPEDLFFMQIQGSGLLVFENGQRLRAAYAGDNGKAFVPIARHMIRDGQLQQNGASGDAIRGWLSGHSGDQAKQVMNKNPRYVFFRLKTDDGREPTGAAGVPLPPGRAIALDNSRHAYGELYWIDAQAPTLSGAAVRYRRLAMALDTGGAIRGDVRADLYLGTGQDAGREAGRVKHVLHMARLVPFDPDNAEATLAASNSPGRR